VKLAAAHQGGDQPGTCRSETARYTDPMPEGKCAVQHVWMECKSVITRHRADSSSRPGFYEITGLAWSGAAKIRAVERVGPTAGRNWREAMIEEPIMDSA